MTPPIPGMQHRKDLGPTQALAVVVHAVEDVPQHRLVLLLHQIGGDLVFPDGTGYAGGHVELFAGRRVILGEPADQTLRIEEHGQGHRITITLLLSRARESLLVQIVGEPEAFVLCPGIR